MAFDAFVLKAVAREIEARLIPGPSRVSKVFQLNSTDILIFFRGEGRGEPLFISIHPQKARLHFTQQHYLYPLSPPPFSMLLRKHLGNGQLVSLRQPPLERIIYLDFLTAGEEKKKTLVSEIMGRHSNLVLLDSPGADGKHIILGALKPVPPYLNRFRAILPRHTYHPPPSQEKLHPYALSLEHFCQEALRLTGMRADRFLLENIQGLSPFLAREIAARSNTESVSSENAFALWEKLQELLEIYDQGACAAVLCCDNEGRPVDFFPFKPMQQVKGRLRSFHSPSSLLDEFYTYRERLEKQEKLQQYLLRKIENFLDKAKKKERNQAGELNEAEKAEQYRLQGELLLLNLKQIPEKSPEVILENILAESGEKIKIILDPALSPSLNAQRYFKKYRKARQGQKRITKQLQQTRHEVAYLENVLFALEQADLNILKEIEEELQETGYLPREKKTRPAVKSNNEQAGLKPLKLHSSQKEEIYVGRNNRQNEYLSLRFAAKTDLWFHVKDLPGAHVVVKSARPHPTTIEEAALLAAYFSKGASSSNVPVDVTTVKNLRRLPGAGPGMVSYSNHRTLYVTPDENKLQHLLQKN